MSQPVIIKNKIVYGYTDKATICRDMGREDYNDLTEAQQLNGDVCFIQGVDASALAPTNNIWNKLGTTPLDSELPADCSQAINQIKSNLTDNSTLSNGYYILPNGLKIVYGKKEVTKNCTTAWGGIYATQIFNPDITFPITFTQVFTCIVTPAKDGSTTSCWIGDVDYSTGNINAVQLWRGASGNNVKVTLHYCVIGI